MNTLNTLFFPDTQLAARHQLPLLLFFDSLHLLQPVENEKGGNPALPASDSFMEKGFCQVHTPAPLGEDLDRFLHLVNDIKNRKDSYAAQLSNLTLASFSEDKNSGDSKQTILTSILGHQATDVKDKEQLWKARLVLKIAEILDQEEEDLIMHLAGIDSREIEMFRELQGELEEVDSQDPFAEILELKKKVSQPRPQMIRNRFRAWNTLLQSNPPNNAFLLWTTNRGEAADLVFTQYEKKTDREPLMLLQLALPKNFSGEVEESLAEVEAARAELLDLKGEMNEALSALARSGEIVLADPSILLAKAAEWEERFAQIIDARFPAKSYGRSRLSFYLLANLPLSQIFDGRPQERGGNHGLLAVNIPDPD
jgi:hypothetical protein